MPSARASRRGWDLNCRLAVNGIQRCDRSGGLAGAFMRVAPEVTPAVCADRACGGRAGDEIDSGPPIRE
ncbi:Uncharacterised protein [Bordetella pertussis]|nr:Uncharacterised protein [Bordetella pertussis]